MITLKGEPLLLSVSALEAILNDENVCAYEVDRFRLILWWYKSNSLGTNLEIVDKVVNLQKHAESTLSVASRLIETYIDLNLILPNDLELLVEPSNLVPLSTLVKTYTFYAVLNQDISHGFGSTVSSRYSCWEAGSRICTSESKEQVTILLNTHRSMNKGIHTWSM